MRRPGELNSFNKAFHNIVDLYLDITKIVVLMSEKKRDNVHDIYLSTNEKP